LLVSIGVIALMIVVLDDFEIISVIPNNPSWISMEHENNIGKWNKKIKDNSCL
jgi:hypothetical protein